MSDPAPLVVALGGNALQDPGGEETVESDLARTTITARYLAGLIASGRRVVVSHGNGPQVGNHLLRSELGHVHGDLPSLPLDVCVADTQGGMGYVLQQCLGNALAERDIAASVAAVVTQVLVDQDDPAFETPSKPIGHMIPAESVEVLKRQGWALMEDTHRRAWRRVVPSPHPKEIVEAHAIKAMVDDGIVVIASGGGGIPVVHSGDGSLRGVPAVVDKDLASALLGADLGAEALLILTDVPFAYVGFGTPDQRALRDVSLAEARAHLEAGEFGDGSMGPKMDAAIRFVAATGRPGIVSSIENAEAALRGETGTRVVA